MRLSRIRSEEITLIKPIIFLAAILLTSASFAQKSPLLPGSVVAFEQKGVFLQDIFDYEGAAIEFYLLPINPAVEVKEFADSVISRARSISPQFFEELSEKLGEFSGKILELEELLAYNSELAEEYYSRFGLPNIGPTSFSDGPPNTGISIISDIAANLSDIDIDLPFAPNLRVIRRMDTRNQSAWLLSVTVKYGLGDRLSHATAREFRGFVARLFHEDDPNEESVLDFIRDGWGRIR